MSYKYTAKIDENGIVVMTLTCDSIEWCKQALGGTWIPYYELSECAIGWKWDGETFIATMEEL